MTALAATPEDYRWLTSAAAAPWLAEAAAQGEPSVAQVARLRQHLSPPQAHLVIEQVALRARAKAKFRHASRMFFATPALEQATDEIVAAYKAQRFPPGQPVVDFCCGIGGDLLSLAARGPALGVDRDPIMALLARTNAAAVHEVASCAAIAQPQADAVAAAAGPELLDDAGAWHIDPDRRPSGRRTTRVEFHEPGPELIDKLLARQPAGAVKLAPAAELPAHWPAQAELEWISRHGVCRQLVAWFGPLTMDHGRHRATVVGHAQGVRTLVGYPDKPLATAGAIGRYLFEPDAAVLAAHLQGVLAGEHGLAEIAPQVAYWTGDRLFADAALAAFVVSEVLPFDVRRVKSLLRERRCGRLEVKQRGTGLEPAAIQRQLRVAGDSPATLLLARIKGQVTAIVAQRVTSI